MLPLPWLAGGGAVVMRPGLPIGAAAALTAPQPAFHSVSSRRTAAHPGPGWLRLTANTEPGRWAELELRTHPANKLIRNCRNVPTVKLD